MSSLSTTQTREEIEALHKRAIMEAPALLSAFQREPGLLTESESPLSFSRERGCLPVLVPEGADPLSVDSRGIFVAANGGAQLQNSPVFLDRSEGSRRVVLQNAAATSHAMLAYTRPEDSLVLSSERPAESEIALRNIGESYASIGIATTGKFVFTESMEDWLRDHGGREPILPNVIEPSLLVSYARDPEHLRKLIRSGIVNVAAYTKDGAEISWSANGIPTPLTAYHRMSGELAGEIAADIRERFQDFDHVVISRLDGSGGFGIHLLPLATLEGASLTSLFGEEPVQVQGYLPLEDSPCVIANVGPERCEILTASSQRFRRFGAHCGNIWSRTYFPSLESDVPGLSEVTHGALDHLRKLGVIGQINIDLLIVSPETAERHSLPGRVLLREANIRPAGSSILLRLMNGSLDGAPVETIFTSGLRDVPFEKIASGELLGAAVSLAEPGRTAVVLCNYSLSSRTATLAYLGAAGVKVEELGALQARMHERLRP